MNDPDRAVAAETETLLGQLATVLYAVRERCPMFTVYDHPEDHPTQFVARLWISLPEVMATNVTIGSDDVDGLRMLFMDLGLVRMARSMVDDPNIVESWL